MKDIKITKLSIITILLLWLDLLSKHLFYNIQIIKNSTLITPSFNLGISRSIPAPMTIIIIISIIALIWFVLLYIRWYINTIITWFLIAWTLWNLIDRILLWWVRDFINILIFNFPIFNIADVLLNIWIIIIIYLELFAWKRNKI
jgi:signal peptidase II